MSSKQTILVTPRTVVAPPADESLDGAIETTTAGLSALVTQFIRHSLYTGMHALEDRLQGIVQDRLETAVTERLPLLEETVTAAADRVSQLRATEVAREHVAVLEVRTAAADRELAAQLAETAEGLAERLEETADGLTSRLTETAEGLTGRIDATLEQARANDAVVRDDLGGRIVQVESRAQEATTAVAQEVERLRQKSKTIVADLRGGITTLRERADALEQLIKEESRERKAAEESRRKAEQEALRAASEFREQALRQLEGLKQENEALRSRLEVLERPRGLAALWAWLVRRPKKGQKAKSQETS